MNRLIVHGTGRSGTTITQRIINSHPYIWVTNEFLLYDLAFCYYSRNRLCDTAKNYFTSLIKQDAWTSLDEHRVQEPYTLNRETFVEECLSNLENDSILGRIEAVEKTLYKDTEFIYFGDKLLESLALERLMALGLDYKLIYVYRDIRDVVAAKTLKGFEINKSDSYDMDCTIDYLTVKKAISFMKPENVLMLRYEDYETDLNITKIANFLNEVGGSLFYINYTKLINKQRLNIGLYKQVIPDWETKFNLESIKVLQELNYI